MDRLTNGQRDVNMDDGQLNGFKGPDSKLYRQTDEQMDRQPFGQTNT